MGAIMTEGIEKQAYCDRFKYNTKKILKSMGMNQKEFAKNIGMGEHYLHDLMTVGRRISLYDAIKIANELGEYVEDMCTKDL